MNTKNKYYRITKIHIPLTYHYLFVDFRPRLAAIYFTNIFKNLFNI